MSNTSMIIETDVSQLELDERGFIRISLLDTGKDFNITEANRQIAAAYELTNGKPYKALVDTTKSTISPSTEVKQLIAGVEHKIREAIVVKTLGNRIIGNIYLKIINKRYPCKIFNNEDSAIEWLLMAE